MKAIQRTLVAAAVVVLLGGWVLPLQASLLDYSADAYQDPDAPNGIAWYGSTPYTNSGGSLSGTVNWVVFAPGEFPPALSGPSFTPPAGELVYAFQISSTGSLDTSTLQADIEPGCPADSIGSFPLGSGVAPGTGPGDVTLNPGASAYWYFPGGILTGQSSIGLAYASPNTPQQEYGSLIDGGANAYASPLPTPSTALYVVPEPSTVILLAAAAILLGLRRRLWRI